jgi:tape measure domain-containing protein
MADEIASIGIRVETDSINQGRRSLESLAALGPKVEKSMQGVERSTAKTGQNLRLVGEGAAQGARGLDRMSDATTRLATSGRSAEAALARINSVAGALTASLGVAQLVRYSDTWASLEGRLKLVTTSQRNLLKVQGDLFTMSQRTRVGFEATVDTYARIARSTRELGVSQTRLLAVTESINKALIVSGSAGASAQAALFQLGQAFASGELRGEELNSVLEQTPRLAQAIADGMGVTIGQLREMGKAGQLTAASVFQALESQGDAISREFQQLPVTISQSLTTLNNELTKFIGQSANASGASQALASAISSVANNLDTLVAAGIGLVAAGVSKEILGIGASALAVGRQVAAASATMTSQRAAAVAAAQAEALAAAESVTALQAQRASTIAVAQAQVQKTASTVAGIEATQAAIVAARAQYTAELQAIQAYQARGLVMQGQSQVLKELATLGAQEARVTKELTAAKAAQAAAEKALSTARVAGMTDLRTASAAATTATAAATAATGLYAKTAATAAAAGRAFSTVIGALGGPIGAIATAIGLAATAWTLFGNKAEEAATETERAVKRIRESLNEDLAAESRLGALVAKTQRQAAEMRAAGNERGAVEAEARVARLQAQLQQIDGRIKEQRAEAERIKAEQERGEQVERNSLARRSSAQAILNRQQQAYAEFMEKNASKAEKFAAAVAKARQEMGALYSPEVERRIRTSIFGEGRSGGSNQQATAYANLVKQINAKIEATQREIRGEGDLTESARLHAQVLEELTGARQQDALALVAALATEEKALAAAREAIKVASDRAAARKQEAEAIDAWEKAQRDSAAQALKSVEERISALQQEEQAVGIAARDNVTLAQAIELVAIARLQERQARYIEGSEPWLEVQKEIDKRRELLGLIRTKDAREAAANAAQATLDEFNRTNDQIGQSLADALMEGGKSAWEYIKGLFRSQVLAPIIKAVIAPVTGGLASLATGGASAATGGNALSGLSSLTGLTSIGTFGGGLSAGFGGLMGSLGLSATGTTLGGALSAGWTALGAGNIAGGLGTLAGALGPIALGIGALASLFGDRNKWSGQFGETQIRNGRAGEVDTRSTFTNSNYSADVSRTTAQVGQTIADTIAAFGGATQDFILRQFSATASKKDRAQAGTDLFIGGEFVSIGNVEVAKDQQAAAFAEQTSRAMLVALQRSITGKLGEYFNSIDALTADIESVQTVLQTAEAVRVFGESAQWLGGVFDSLAGMGVQATADLAAAAGGFDALSQSATQAYQLLYTEEERIAFLTEDVTAAFAKLGVAMPTTAEGYRLAVEEATAAMNAGVPGADKLLASLLQLVPAWDTMTNSIRAATQAAMEAQIQTAEDQIAGIETAMQAITDTFGDVEAAMRLLESPAETLVDAWTRTRTEIDRLTTVLNGPSLSSLDNWINAFEQIGTARGSIADQIFQLEVNRDPQGAVEVLRKREQELWASFGQAPDKAAVAAAITKLVTDRIQLEGQIEQRALQEQADAALELNRIRLDGEIELKEASIRSIEEQIDALGRMQGYLDDINDLTRSLLYSDVSPLSPRNQLNALQADYQRTLSSARGGDEDALRMLGSVAQEYLRQGQDYFGNTGGYAGSGGVFERVLADLQSMGLMSTGTAGLDGQLQDRQAELEVLREQRDALNETTAVIVDTTDRQINALRAIDEQLAGGQDLARQQLEAELETRRQLVANQEAQIRQQSAILASQNEQIQGLRDEVTRLREIVESEAQRQ